MLQQSIARLAASAPYLTVKTEARNPVIRLNMADVENTAAPASLVRLQYEPGKGFSQQEVEQMITALLLGRGDKIGLEALCDYWRQHQTRKLLTLDILRELGRIIYNDAVFANDYSLHSLVGMHSDEHVGVYPRDGQGIAWLKSLHQAGGPVVYRALQNLEMDPPFIQQLSFLTSQIETNRNLLPWQGPADPTFVESLILGHAWIRTLLPDKGMQSDDATWLNKLKTLDLCTEYPKHVVLLGDRYRALWRSEQKNSTITQALEAAGISVPSSN